MIDKRDFLEYDIQVVTLPKKYTNKARLVVRCHSCRRSISISLEKYLKRRLSGPWSCKQCVLSGLYEDPVYKNSFRQMHTDPSYRSKVHNKEVRQRISESLKRVWRDRRAKR